MLELQGQEKFLGLTGNILSRLGKSFLYQSEGEGRQIRDKSQRSYHEDYSFNMDGGCWHQV